MTFRVPLSACMQVLIQNSLIIMWLRSSILYPSVSWFDVLPLRSWSSYRANDIYGDGIIYYQVANAAKHQYYIFTITPKVIVMKLLSFKHIFILGALLAAGSVQAHAADEVTGKVRSWN